MRGSMAPASIADHRPIVPWTDAPVTATGSGARLGALAPRLDDGDPAGQVGVGGDGHEGRLDARDVGHRVGEGEDRRARPGQAGAQRAGLARRLDQPRQLRVDRRPVRLVDAIDGQAPQQVGPAGGQPGDAEGDGPEVGDDVLDRDAAPAAPCACPTVDSRSSGMNRTARRSRGGSKRRAATSVALAGRRRRSHRAGRRRRCPGGPRSRSRGAAWSPRRGRRRRGARRRRRSRRPSPRPTSRGRAPGGSRCASSIRQPTPSGSSPRASTSAASRPRTKRLSRSSPSSLRPSPSTVSSISPRLQLRTSSSTRLAMARATPRQS